MQAPATISKAPSTAFPTPRSSAPVSHNATFSAPSTSRNASVLPWDGLPIPVSMAGSEKTPVMDKTPVTSSMMPPRSEQNVSVTAQSLPSAIPVSSAASVPKAASPAPAKTSTASRVKSRPPPRPQSSMGNFVGGMGGMSAGMGGMVPSFLTPATPLGYAEQSMRSQAALQMLLPKDVAAWALGYNPNASYSYAPHM